jgi:hypothetical protein
MVETSLVGPDIAVGEAVLAALDAAKFPVTVALWLRETEEDKWELVLSTPRYREDDIYLQAILAIRSRVPIVDFPIRIESNLRPLIKALRLKQKLGLSLEGRRLGPQALGGVWVRDAYVYRIK